MSNTAEGPVLPPPEFSRLVDPQAMVAAPLHLEANSAERAALARRFGLVRIASLRAEVALTREGAVVRATGRLRAAIVQVCAISGEDLPVAIDEPLALRFVPEVSPHPGAEVEITAEDCDDIAYAGPWFDLGEAIAQSLALAIDPFAEGPEAARVRAAGLLGEAAPGTFAGLAALKGRLPG